MSNMMFVVCPKCGKQIPISISIDETGGNRDKPIDLGGLFFAVPMKIEVDYSRLQEEPIIVPLKLLSEGKPIINIELKIHLVAKKRENMMKYGEK